MDRWSEDTQTLRTERSEDAPIQDIVRPLPVASRKGQSDSLLQCCFDQSTVERKILAFQQASDTFNFEIFSPSNNETMQEQPLPNEFVAFVNSTVSISPSRMNKLQSKGLGSLKGEGETGMDFFNAQNSPTHSRSFLDFLP